MTGRRAFILTAAAIIAALVPWAGPASAAPPGQSLHMEDLTWVEVRDAIRSGKTTVIVPTGGVEQNGPHMVLGKHRYIVHHTAGKIAAELGDALVAPVVDYVPEGAVAPPSGHMRFAGTISIPSKVFAGVLEHTARSLRAHGFKSICFLGDSGGNQAPQAAVAEKLNREWADSGVRVIQVGDYYAANGQMEFLRKDGESEKSIGRHAGIRDTSELMAVHPAGVRRDRLASGDGNASLGVDGDPSRASAARGERMLRLKITTAVRQIRKARIR